MKAWLFLAAINGALAVAAGAFAAHGLKARLDANALSVFETGARYHMYHALAMGLAAQIVNGQAGRGAAASSARLAAGLFLAGIILFSGSLYLLALTGNSVLGIIMPIGGVAFLAGWVLLAAAALKQDRP